MWYTNKSAQHAFSSTLKNYKPQKNNKERRVWAKPTDGERDKKKKKKKTGEKGRMSGRVIGSWLPFRPAGLPADAQGCVMGLHAVCEAQQTGLQHM